MVQRKLKKLTERLLLWWQKKFITRDSFVENSVYTLGWSKVRIGKNSIVGEQGWININNKSGDSPRLIIGNNCYIGPRAIISTGKKIEISDYFLCGHDCRFIGANHIFDTPLRPYVSTGAYDEDVIEIEENVWLGLNVVVIGDVRIGRGSIISASSVVTKDIPPFSIAVGAPCKVIKRYSFLEEKWKNIAAWSKEDEKAILNRADYLSILAESGDLELPLRAATRKFGDTF